MTAKKAQDNDPADVDRFAERLKTLAGVIAPTTVLSALLLYFGYVATLTRFAYFGVSLDLVDLPTQQLLLYGVEAVYVPLALVGIALLLGFALHAVMSALLASPVWSRRIGAWSAVVLVLAAVLLLIRALRGILTPNVAAREIPGTTPLSLVVGAFLATYGAGLVRRALAQRASARRAPDAPVAWFDHPSLIRNWLLVCVLLTVAGLFWAANSFASAYGGGRALDDVDGLAHRPEVVIITPHRLLDLPPPAAQTEQRLPGGEGEPVLYQYGGLRLLAATSSRLFLVPAPWTGTSWAVVIPYDADVSLRLVPQR